MASPASTSSLGQQGKQNTPLAFVPVDQDKVVVVATQQLPDSNHLNSPRNHEFLQQHAQDLASPSTSSQPIEKKSLPAKPKLKFRPRSKTVDGTSWNPIDADTSALASSNDNTPTPNSDVNSRRRPRSGSWFVDATTRSTATQASAHNNPILMEQSYKARRGRSSSVPAEKPSLQVILSPEARAELAHSVQPQNRRGSISVMADGMNPEDIVDHLSVIDAHIATVSHLSNAANSILLPPLSFYTRKPVVDMPPVHMVTSRTTDRHELDQHVEDVLSKRDKFRRTMSGFWAYLKTPVGILTAIYGFLVVFWGSAIVLFLGKLINLHNPYLQGFWVEISAQVVNALFTIQGVGFLPWRIMDTWHIVHIMRFQRLTRDLRQKAGLPDLGDDNDIPDPLVHPDHVQVLTDRQLMKLRYHQVKFMNSQTWYRPHATETHRAFSIKMALWICIFVDLNSLFQILLCVAMWGWNRFERPAWTIGSLIPLSFLCGIIAGVLIWKGGANSQKTEEVEQKLKAALSQEKNVMETRYGSGDSEKRKHSSGVAGKEPVSPASTTAKSTILSPKNDLEEAVLVTTSPAAVGTPSDIEPRKSASSDRPNLATGGVNHPVEEIRTMRPPVYGTVPGALTPVVETPRSMSSDNKKEIGFNDNAYDKV